MNYYLLSQISKISIGEFVHKDKQNPNGQYPVYNGGCTPTGYYDFYNNTENKIVISARGNAGFVNKVTTKYWAGNSSYSIDVNSDFAFWKYVYYYLKQYQEELISQQQKGGGVPAISKKQVQEIEIPLPSLSEQQRIVDILDKFEGMVENVEEEILLRQKQYEHYREKIFDFQKSHAEIKTIGDVIKHLRTGLNPRVHFKLNTPDANCYYITVRELKGLDAIPDEKTDKINDTARLRIDERSKLKINDILFSGTGTIGRTAIIKEQPTNWNIKEGVYALTPDVNKVHPYYLLYMLHSSSVTNQIESKAAGAAVRSVPMVDFKNIEIPVPSLDKQQEIVANLDKFEEMISTLKKELELRKKQYEYYREKLLTFE